VCCEVNTSCLWVNFVSERIFVRKCDNNLWQWRHLTPQGQWANASFYTGDINLLAESVAGKAVTLLLPGQQVVSQYIETDLKDRKLINKVIPYQIEDAIIDNIDDLVFAYGPIQDGRLLVVYVKEDLARQALAELEATGADVQRILVDYLELSAPAGQWTLLLDGDNLFVLDEQQTGFVADTSLAPLYLASALGQVQPQTLVLVADDEAEVTRLKSWLPAAVTPEEGWTLMEELGGFWDFVLMQPKPAIDFRQGRLARQLPFAQWWHEWKLPAVAAACAFGLALGTTAFELASAKKMQKAIIAERDSYYRQVIPGNGSVVNPVNTLKGKLGSGNTTEASNLMGMMATVGPAMAAYKDVKLSSFRYTVENGELQLNLEAKDISTLEALRGKIAEAGLGAEIKRASVSGETNQAQMRITENRS
jgi:general secretion pathway protein L